MLHKNLLVVAIIILSGLALSGIAGWLYFQQANLERNGLSTEGIVIGLAESSDSEGTTYAPIVRFRTQGGRSFEFQSNHSSYPPAYEIGQKVTVLYPPEQPAQAVVKGEGNLLIIIFGLVGMGELLIGTFLGLKNFSSRIYGE